MGRNTATALVVQLAVIVVALSVLFSASLPWWLHCFALLVLCILLASLVVWFMVAAVGVSLYFSPNRETARGLWHSVVSCLAAGSGLFDVRYIDVHNRRSKDGGPVIFVVNHMHVAVLETIAVPIIAPNCRTVAACVETPVIREVFENVHCIPVVNPKQGGNTEAVVGGCAKALQEGYNVLIFPEGKHNHLKKEWHFLEAIQTGAFILAKRTGRPIVPVAFGPPCDAPQWVATWGLVWPFGHQPIDIRYMPSLYPQCFETAEEMREEARCAINKALARPTSHTHPTHQTTHLPNLLQKPLSHTV